MNAEYNNGAVSYTAQAPIDQSVAKVVEEFLSTLSSQELDYFLVDVEYQNFECNAFERLIKDFDENHGGFDANRDEILHELNLQLG